MGESQKNIIKAILLSLGGVVIILLVWLVIFQKPIKSPTAVVPQEPEKNSSDSENSNVPQVVEISEEENSSKEVSKDIPHFEEAEKISSYTMQYPNSAKTQDVYRFYSSKNMDEALAFYQDWAKKNEWSEANVVKEDNLFSLYLTKSEEMLVVKISKEEDKVSVNLDLLKEEIQ